MALLDTKDDDIDLAMLRPDYDKLITYLKNHNKKIKDNLEAISLELDNSDYPFLKIINVNYFVDEPGNGDKYLWIDIFPLDATPEDNKSFFKKVSILNKIFILRRAKKNKVPLLAANRFKRFIKNIFVGIIGIWKYENFVKFYLKYCTKYNYDEYEYVHNNVWTYSPAIHNKKDFKNADYKFEDLIVNGPLDYDKFLSGWYGKDYMKLPPKEKRVTHNLKVWRKER